MPLNKPSNKKLLSFADDDEEVEENEEEWG